MALKGFAAPAALRISLELPSPSISLPSKENPHPMLLKNGKQSRQISGIRWGLTHSLLAFRFLDITLASGESFESHSPAVSADLRVGVIGHRSDSALANASCRSCT